MENRVTKKKRGSDPVAVDQAAVVPAIQDTADQTQMDTGLAQVTAPEAPASVAATAAS